MKKMLIAAFILFTFGCGSSGFGLNDVVEIPAGDKEGTGLSGAYIVIHEVTNDGCSDVAALEIPVSGTETNFDAEVTVEDGLMMITNVEDLTLRGGVYFDNTFELGGAQMISRGDGEENILRMVRLTGTYESDNKFLANGEARFKGRITTEDVDCTYTFKIQGLVKS